MIFIKMILILPESYEIVFLSDCRRSHPQKIETEEMIEQINLK